MSRREDIIKQYSLPERQSKIDLIMKQEEQGLEEQVYCICRSTDTSRFMIGCDNCEEWYHGDCIDVTEEESRFIKKFYCPKCRQNDPTLEIKYKKKKLEKAGKEDPSKKPNKREAKETVSSQYPQCGECIACYRVEDCGKCDSCRAKPRLQCKYRVCLTFAPKQKKVEIKTEDEILPKPVLKETNHSDDDVWEPTVVAKKEKSDIAAHKRSRHSTNKREKGKGRHRSSANEQRRAKRINSSPEQGNDSDADRSPVRSKTRIVQCYGQKCLNASRPGSKYCSEQCGLSLATARIYQILPQRIQEWNLTACIAEEKNKKELELIRKQQNEARSALQDLDQKQKDLEDIITRAKSFTVDTHDDDDEETGEGEVESATVQCVTCGIGLTVRNAIRHMERCFNKHESQTSFGSIFQTKIEGNNMFCDFYNPSNRTYCKRLRVLCPEHCKDPKVNDSDVCGYPLVRKVFDETGEFCLVPKKKCVKHNNWEKLRRAEIDMERVRVWLKLDELFERERQIRSAMAQRAGLLPLMLHSTFNHEILPQQFPNQQSARIRKTESPEKCSPKEDSS